jgi:hypothetical protein
MSRSLTEERTKYWGVEVPEPANGVVRGDIIKNCLYIEQIDRDSCWYTAYVHVDCKLSYIPDFLVNFVIKRIIYIMVGML